MCGECFVGFWILDEKTQTAQTLPSVAKSITYLLNASKDISLTIISRKCVLGILTILISKQTNLQRKYSLLLFFWRHFRTARSGVYILLYRI